MVSHNKLLDYSYSMLWAPHWGTVNLAHPAGLRWLTGVGNRVEFLRERRQGLDSREVLGNAKRQLVNIATSRTMWGAAGLMALFYIAPGFATALFYKQQNELHLSTQAQGFLGLIAGSPGPIGKAGIAGRNSLPWSRFMAARPFKLAI